MSYLRRIAALIGLQAALLAWWQIIRLSLDHLDAVGPEPAPPVGVDAAEAALVRLMVFWGESISAIRRLGSRSGLDRATAHAYVSALRRWIDDVIEGPLQVGDAPEHLNESAARIHALSGMPITDARNYAEALAFSTSSWRPAQAQASPPAPDMAAVAREAQVLLEAGQAIRAMQHVCEVTGWGAKQALEFIQNLGASSSPDAGAPPPP